MHPNSRRLMRALISRHKPSGLIYDIGGRDLNGTYRDLIPPACQYKSLDIRRGRNVDIIVPENGTWRLPPADMAISGQCLEHVKRPWLWMQQVASILKLGGKFLVIVPWNYRYHGPIDCWRVLPDGLAVLFIDARLTILETGRDHNDTFGVAQKV